MHFIDLIVSIVNVFFFIVDLVRFNQNVITQSLSESTYFSCKELSFHLFHLSFNKYIVWWEHASVQHNRNDSEADRGINQNKSKYNPSVRFCKPDTIWIKPTHFHLQISFSFFQWWHWSAESSCNVKCHCENLMHCVTGQWLTFTLASLAVGGVLAWATEGVVEGTDCSVLHPQRRAHEQK